MSQKVVRLLNSSKLAGLNKSAKPYSAFDPKFVPTHQVVQTTSASLNRQDFGLKAALPTKNTSRYVIVDDLDTFEGMARFEPSSGHYWIKRRFQELGIPVIVSDGMSPLFKDSKNKSSVEEDKILNLSDVLGINSQTSKAELKDILNQVQSSRNDFKQFILSKHPEKLNAKSFKSSSLRQEALSFLKEMLETKKITRTSSKGISFINQSAKLKGSAGLSYLQKGRLNSTVYGYTEASVVPGRILADTGVFGIAGFANKPHIDSAPIQAAARYVPNKHYREVMIPVAVNGAKLRPNGSVTIESTLVKKSSLSSFDSERSDRDGFSSRASKQINAILENI